MLNQTVLVGRVANIIEVSDKSVELVLSIPRNYKNENGTYDNDFINCTLFNGIAQSVIEYCKTGDLVGVRGRLTTTKVENSKEDKFIVVADRVTFLSARKEQQ